MITINSKYKIGDEVWTMSLNKPVFTKIKDIRLETSYMAKSVEERLKWELEQTEPNSYSVGSYGLCIYRSEYELFDTKEELIKSL